MRNRSIGLPCAASSWDIVTTRQTLLAIIENLAEDEANSTGRIPSTRELARLVAARGASAGTGMLKRPAR